MMSVDFRDQIFTSTAATGGCQVGLNQMGEPMSVEDSVPGDVVFPCNHPARWHYVKRPKNFDPRKHKTVTAQTCHAHRPDPDILPEDVTERCLVE